MKKQREQQKPNISVIDPSEIANYVHLGESVPRLFPVVTVLLLPLSAGLRMRVFVCVHFFLASVCCACRFTSHSENHILNTSNGQNIVDIFYFAVSRNMTSIVVHPPTAKKPTTVSRKRRNESEENSTHI